MNNKKLETFDINNLDHLNPKKYQIIPGDVFIHTKMAVDAATEFRTGEEEHDLILMFSVLCHDFGKPSTTKIENGRIRSKEHEEAGEEPTRNFLEKMKISPYFIDKIVVLVKHHLIPAHFHKNKPTASAYRRLARKLAEKELTLELLEKVSRSDCFGRLTDDAKAKIFKAGDLFLEKALEANVQSVYKPISVDVVMGRHLIELGFKPGPDFGKILKICREVQDETGNCDHKEILKQVLHLNENGKFDCKTWNNLIIKPGIPNIIIECPGCASCI